MSRDLKDTICNLFLSHPHSHQPSFNQLFNKNVLGFINIIFDVNNNAKSRKFRETPGSTTTL